MSEAALAGFSAAWALLAQVLPVAERPTPAAVAAAANAIQLPPGSLPNGSGLQFGEPGHRDRRRQPARARRDRAVDGARAARRRLAGGLRHDAARADRPAAVTGRAARALAAGIAVTAVYAASAMLSGHLSPLARRPLLDGLAPATPYRWVEPPPELAATNLEPDERVVPRRPRRRRQPDGRVHHGRRPGVPDPGERIVRGRAGQRFVDVTIEPIAPSTLAAPPLPERIVGNVYRIEGDVRTLRGPRPARHRRARGARVPGPVGRPRRPRGPDLDGRHLLGARRHQRPAEHPAGGRTDRDAGLRRRRLDGADRDDHAGRGRGGRARRSRRS